MRIKAVRLLLLLGLLTLLVASKEEPVFALSYCCDDCVAAENNFASECPGGASQSDYCDHLDRFISHCWLFCSSSLCQPPHPTGCHYEQIGGSYYTYVCH